MTRLAALRSCGDHVLMGPNGVAAQSRLRAQAACAVILEGGDSSVQSKVATFALAVVLPSSGPFSLFPVDIAALKGDPLITLHRLPTETLSQLYPKYVKGCADVGTLSNQSRNGKNSRSLSSLSATAVDLDTSASRRRPR